MKCPKCNNELSSKLEETIELCSDCAIEKITTKNVMDEINDEISADEPYKTKYAVITALNFLAKLVMVCACIAIAFFVFFMFIGVNKLTCFLWIVAIALSGTLSSAVLFAISEILNTLYDIREKL